MPLVVRLACKEDLGICEEHMRRILDEDLRGYHQRWHHDIDDLTGTYLDRAGWAQNGRFPRFCPFPRPDRLARHGDGDNAIAGAPTARPRHSAATP